MQPVEVSQREGPVSLRGRSKEAQQSQVAKERLRLVARPIWMLPVASLLVVLLAALFPVERRALLLPLAMSLRLGYPNASGLCPTR
jgi:hypothetical protein